LTTDSQRLKPAREIVAIGLTPARVGPIVMTTEDDAMIRITTTEVRGSTMIHRLDYSPIGGGRGILVAWLRRGGSIARVVPSWVPGLIAAGWPVAGERSSPGRAVNVFLLGREPKDEPPVRGKVHRAAQPFRGPIRRPKRHETAWTRANQWIYEQPTAAEVAA
jgi:hypothetical protein